MFWTKAKPSPAKVAADFEEKLRALIKTAKAQGAHSSNLFEICVRRGTFHAEDHYVHYTDIVHELETRIADVKFRVAANIKPL